MLLFLFDINLAYFLLTCRHLLKNLLKNIITIFVDLQNNFQNLEMRSLSTRRKIKDRICRNSCRQSSHGFSRQKRIVKGHEAELGDYPYQVSIQNIDSDYHHCGGIIINEHYVLTAGHCLAGFTPDEFKIISGTNDLRKPNFTNYVCGIRVHEHYDIDDSWKNDLALMEVCEPFIFNDFIAPATLPNKNDKVPINSEGLVTGFGRTSEQSFTSKVLRVTEMTVKDLDYCNEQYKKINLHFRDTQLCGYDEERAGICKGDSGGPLIVNKKVFGVISYTDKGCVDSGYPSVFTKIAAYIDWIQTYAK